MQMKTAGFHMLQMKKFWTCQSLNAIHVVKNLQDDQNSWSTEK